MSNEQSNAELVESMQQIINAWTLVGRGLPGRDQVDRDSLAIRWAGTSFPFYNAIFLTDLVSDASVLEASVRQAAHYLKAQEKPGLFMVFPEQLSGSAKERFQDILSEANLEVSILGTGMAGDIFPLASDGHPELRFVRISDESTIRTMAELNCAAYDLPAELAGSVAVEQPFWTHDAYGYIAYEGDKAVATATTVVNGDCIYLFAVATLPEAQRQGYGEALARHALQAANTATGIGRAVLHATAAGYPCYVHLGFRPVTPMHICCLAA